MSPREVEAELSRMAASPGIGACALVEADNGLVWLSAGAPHDASVWEAAVDYWRLHQRQQAHFAELGALGAAVMYHARGVLAILPCCPDPNLLLVARGAHGGVDWIDWQRRGRALGAALSASVNGATSRHEPVPDTVKLS